MIIILYIAALIFALAFTALVVYLIKVLKETERTMGSMANTLEGLETQMEGITTETTLLLNRTNQLAEDINDKSQRLNTVVDSVKGIGDTVNSFNQSIRNVSSTISHVAEKNKEETAQVIKWGTVVMQLFNKRKGNNENPYSNL
ncbi:uncharacterized protein YoxC [Natronobacillus azotifigens]|uniref:DUF948 domain-containing protein n=1 Tax=Natronobacillus azotifigens TaxID=472978 RepID=A0A9J6RD02_9BACI|nr:DUF948 domain-containing protein [Natronobacillus azotifigens]MCZ0703238.1 DUF948 domain-containing protein [Natronobacillus azotifigens]